MTTNNINNYGLQNSNSGNQNSTSIYNTGTFKNVTYYGELHKSSGDEGARWKLLSAAVGIISAVVIAFGPALVKDDATAAENSRTTSTQAKSEPPTSATPSTPSLSDTTSEGAKDPVDEPTPDVTNTALDNPETYKPDNIDIKIYDQGIYGGDKIGPNKFQIKDSELTLYYYWEAKHGGSAIESDNCEMITTVSGPNGFSGNKTSKCSISSSWSEKLKFTAPGDYTIKVTDRQSNVSGEIKISVLQ
jgi:hypothetical protein